jgi:hypothetical protein
MALTIIAGDVIKIDAEDGQLWWAQNGAKRTRLSLYAAQGVHIESVDSNIPVYLARSAVPVWVGDDRNREASVYLRPSENEGIYAIWLNSHCGFDVVPKDAVLWQASSVGGPKNSESKIAVLKPPCYIEEFTYKFRTPSDWFSVALDGVVRCLRKKSDVIALALRGDRDAERLAELKGWLSELTTAGQLEVQDET